MKKLSGLSAKLNVSIEKLEFLVSEGFLSRGELDLVDDEALEKIKNLLSQYEPVFKRGIIKLVLAQKNFRNKNFLEDAISTTFKKKNFKTKFKSGRILLKSEFYKRIDEIMSSISTEYSALINAEIEKVTQLESEQNQLFEELEEMKNNNSEITELERTCNNIGQLLLLEKVMLTHLEDCEIYEQNVSKGIDRIVELKRWMFEKMKNDANNDGYVLPDFKYFRKKVAVSELITKNMEILIFKNKEVNAIYANYLDKHLLSHPKDEYPEARAIHRYFYIHYGPTNSGKTYESLERLKKARKGVYLAPLRLLALEVYEKLNDAGVPCNLLTGEEEIGVSGSNHISSTVEKLKLTETYDVAVIDEAQMMADEQRGHAWIRAVLGVRANEIHLCCSKDAVSLLCEIIRDCDEKYEIVEHTRNTPLIVEEKKFKFPANIQKGDALIVFSRKSVISLASHLNQLGFKVSVIYGNLPPETRKRQVKAFSDGETDVVVSTDAIGMGLNLPVRRIIFMEMEKYDGEKTRLLRTKEILQIAGRAGRRGIYDAGFVTTINEKTKFSNVKPTDYLKDRMKSDLKPLEFCYIHPDENFIVNFPVGDISKRLRAWKDHQLNSNIFLKTDIDVMLELIFTLKTANLLNRLTNSEIYTLINLPFDEKNDELLDLWIFYAKRISEANTQLDFPFEVSTIDTISDLQPLETMYHKLNLYYSILKNFNIPGDIEKIYNTREQIAVRIHEILRTSMSKMSKQCKTCKTPLAWSYPYSICEGCYEKRTTTRYAKR